jgi:hypothetical protein
MRTFLIGYDLNRPVQNYTDLIKAIEAYGTWWHHLDSTWIVKSDRSAMQIINDLRRHIDENDELLVIEHMGEAAWVGFNTKGSDWLTKNL